MEVVRTLKQLIFNRYVAVLMAEIEKLQIDVLLVEQARSALKTLNKVNTRLQ